MNAKLEHTSAKEVTFTVSIILALTFVDAVKDTHTQMERPAKVIS